MDLCRNTYQVHSKRLALPFQLLAVTALMPAVPPAVFAETDMVGDCEPQVSSSALASDVIKVFSLNISHGRKTALNQLFVDKERAYKNLDEIALLINRVNPDIAGLQEADAASRIIKFKCGKACFSMTTLASSLGL